MAEGLGISAAYLTMIEKGERAIPLNFISRVNEICALDQREISQLINAINSHPLSDKSTRQRARINAVMHEVLKIANGIFARLMSKLDFDFEVQSSLSNLIDILQNLKQRIFSNEENELVNRLI